MIKSNLCDFSDAYMHVKGTRQVTNTAAQGAAPNNRNKGVTFKNCAPFIDCVSLINNKQVDDANDIDVVMPMYNLLEYSDICSKTLRRLWQYYRDEPVLNDTNVIIDFPVDDNNGNSYKFKQKITGQINNNGIKAVQIMVSLKYLHKNQVLKEELIGINTN